MCEQSYNKQEQSRIIFTKEMKKNYKILIPNMLPIHFKLFKNILKQENFNKVKN